jgi:hypothetical protein
MSASQRKLGTIIILTVHILQHESVDTGSLPMEDFFKRNPNYFQITLPLHRRTNIGGKEGNLFGFLLLFYPTLRLEILQADPPSLVRSYDIDRYLTSFCSVSLQLFN